MAQIDVAKDFTAYPGGRYPKDGDGNGTTFREKFLEPVLKEHQRARIILDGAMGYPSSFLEEAFGGLVRAGFDAQMIKDSFEFTAERPGFSRFVTKIMEYIDRASDARGDGGRAA